MSIKQKIFKLFGPYEKRIDSNKDNNGKGTLERYMEAYGDDIDTNIIPLIENLVQNIFDPEKSFARFLDYHENTRGSVFISFFRGSQNPDEAAKTEWTRRRILKHIEKLTLIKGTKKCYEILLRLFDPTIENITFTEYYQENRYDSDKLYDDANRYDTTICSECPQYSIDITTQAISVIIDGTGDTPIDGNNETPFIDYVGGGSLGSTSTTPSEDLIKAIKNIVAFNHPIDCKIKYIRYNDTLITL